MAVAEARRPRSRQEELNNQADFDETKPVSTPSTQASSWQWKYFATLAVFLIVAVFGVRQLIVSLGVRTSSASASPDFSAQIEKAIPPAYRHADLKCVGTVLSVRHLEYGSKDLISGSLGGYWETVVSDLEYEAHSPATGLPSNIETVRILNPARPDHAWVGSRVIGFAAVDRHDKSAALWGSMVPASDFLGLAATELTGR